MMEDGSQGGSLEAQIAEVWPRLSPAERKVASYIAQQKSEALLSSAAQIAAAIGTSDATVVRAVQAMGFSGLSAMREALVEEIANAGSALKRLQATLGETGDDVFAALDLALQIQTEALDDLKNRVPRVDLVTAVDMLDGACTIHAFGIGPSRSLAEYLCRQLGRLGCDARPLVSTGFELADGLLALGPGSVVVVLAYGRLYREAAITLEQAGRVGARVVLVSDTLCELRGAVDLMLAVHRGRAGHLAMHGATLALFEALVLGVATRRRSKALTTLETLDELRASLAGARVDLSARTP